MLNVQAMPVIDFVIVTVSFNYVKNQSRYRPGQTQRVPGV
jgi:hypothetical protein